jgi:diguanylate cyclase (GGDEF)-like protein/PAS domain S-box-containing protein
VLSVPHLETPKTTAVADDHESRLQGLEGFLSTADALAKRSVRSIRDTMVRAARRIFGPRWGSLVGRPKLGFVLGFLVSAIAVLTTLSWFQRNQVGEARSAQAALNQIAVLTREMNNLTLTALQTQNLTPEATAEMRAERQALPKAVLAARLQAYHTPPLEKVWPELDEYIMASGRQWVLMLLGDFDEARQADFQEVSPQFDMMQHQVQIAIEAEDKWAQVVALRARNELLAAAILAATAILILFSQFQRQEHIGQLRETERNALRESEERFRALTEQSTDIILIADSSGQIKYASPSVHTVLAVHGDSLVGTNIIDLVHPDDLAKTISTQPRSAASGQNPPVEFRLRHTDGRWLHFDCVVRNLIQDKNIGGIVYNARDITERKHAQEELLFNATHDVLTGLPNRAFFLGRLQSVVDRMKRHPHQVAAVLFIDIDDFKFVNDCYGHATGDVLIKEVSNRLRACIRSEGTIARMGGDEFTILVEDVTDPSDAIRVAQRIQSSFAPPFLVEGREVFKSASIGIALTSPETPAAAVLQNADIAMYRAKSQGKACSELFDRTMHEQVMSRLLLEAKLRYALQNEELALHYQPIVAVDTGAVQGFEALLRWRPSGLNSIPPSTFVPVAEQCGLVVPISVWVLKTACLEAASWRQRYPADPPLYVSINISSKHFSHPAFIGHVKDALQESAVDPQCVTIEITESLAMNDVEAAGQTMSQLRTLGVKLSIDDFGTGYSSLSYLRRFPVHALKIDQSFVATMDAENYAIVKTIVGLARNLDLKVVAEGVETTNQHRLLALAGCGSAQGYLLAEPMPAESVGVFIESNRRNSGHTKQRGLARSTAGF